MANFFGTRHKDTIVGSTGADVIEGLGGNDFLYGDPLNPEVVDGELIIPRRYSSRTSVLDVVTDGALNGQDYEFQYQGKLRQNGTLGEDYIEIKVTNETDKFLTTYVVTPGSQDGLASLVTDTMGCPPNGSRTYLIPKNASVVVFDDKNVDTPEALAYLDNDLIADNLDSAGETASITYNTTLFDANPVTDIVPDGGGATGGADEIYGDRGQDKIFGVVGDDKIVGFKGDDILFGGSGDDTVYGGGDGGTAEVLVLPVRKKPRQTAENVLTDEALNGQDYEFTTQRALRQNGTIGDDYININVTNQTSGFLTLYVVTPGSEDGFANLVTDTMGCPGGGQGRQFVIPKDASVAVVDREMKVVGYLSNDDIAALQTTGAGGNTRLLTYNDQTLDMGDVTPLIPEGGGTSEPSGDDKIYGGDGDDKLYGGSDTDDGADLIDGGLGSNEINGGGGNDIITAGLHIDADGYLILEQRTAPQQVVSDVLKGDLFTGDYEFETQAKLYETGTADEDYIFVQVNNQTDDFLTLYVVNPGSDVELASLATDTMGCPAPASSDPEDQESRIFVIPKDASVVVVDRDMKVVGHFDYLTDLDTVNIDTGSEENGGYDYGVVDVYKLDYTYTLLADNALQLDSMPLETYYQYGDSVSNTLEGGAGDDLIMSAGRGVESKNYGGDGDDTIFIGGGSDSTIDGGNGDDKLHGFSPFSTYIAVYPPLYESDSPLLYTFSSAFTTFTGGAGADEFHISSNTSFSTITDFNADEGDLIVLEMITGNDPLSAAQNGSDGGVVIPIDNGSEGGNEVSLIINPGDYDFTVDSLTYDMFG